MKRILSVALCAVVLITCCALSSLAFGGSMTAELTTDMAEVYTSTHGCHTAKYEAYNDSSSLHDVYVDTQLSLGEGWLKQRQVRLPAGSSAASDEIGNADTTYLCRGIISVASGKSGCSSSITVKIIS